MADTPVDSALLGLTARIVSAHAANNEVDAGTLPSVIRSVYDALVNIDSATAASAPVEKTQPAVPIRKSVFPDYIVCLEDGKRLKMLKRHLSTSYNLTPAQYRQKWGLESSYPMVAPNYAERRSELAKQIGLGTHRAAAR
jgi:predicted transcriptional regulator